MTYGSESECAIHYTTAPQCVRSSIVTITTESDGTIHGTAMALTRYLDRLSAT